MFHWTAKSIKWLDESAQQSKYYINMAASVSKYLSPSMTVCELGCGLGHLTFELSLTLKQIVGVDISEYAIDFAKENLSRENISYIAEDWHKGCKHQVWDVILFHYFGLMQSDWTQIEEMGRKIIIAILPFESTWGNQTGIQNRLQSQRIDKLDTVESMTHFLKKQGKAYMIEPLCYEFGQSFQHQGEVEEYWKHYYKGRKPELPFLDWMEKNVEQREEKLYLSKVKNCGLITINVGLKANE